MKNKKIFRLIRIFFYAIAFFYLLFSEVKEEYSFIICPSKSLFDFDCYLCGMTRAFISMFKLRFIEAISFNPLVLIFYPSLCLIAIQDAYISVTNYLFKKEKTSFLEFLMDKVC